MGKKSTFPHCCKSKRKKREPHEESFFVSAFIKCCFDLWDSWTGCPKLAKAELRLWAFTWVLFIHSLSPKLCIRDDNRNNWVGLPIGHD